MNNLEFQYVIKNKLTDKISMHYFTIKEIEKGINLNNFDNEIISRDLYIGLKDKNDKKIFENDNLRIKNYMNDKKYFTDSIYKVNQINCLGISLTFVKLFDQDKIIDIKLNQFPIHQILSFFHNSLCIDYKNNNYDHICLDDTFGKNIHQGKIWQENHYSNDIEIIERKL